MALQIGERLEEKSVYNPGLRPGGLQSEGGPTTRGGIFHIADYPLLPFLSSNSRDQLARSYRDVTAVLLKNPELRGSLKAFLEANFNVSTAAKKLFLHRNTLIYRLRKISSLTSLDPRKFREAIQLYMALQLSCLEEMSEKKRA
ncbi:MAG: helix-turn-helix domain-containing protein [Actinomycetota bacterium]|nr:helix-turn-helix domain-containing protein [Actinomycetota bacterium]